MMFTDFFDAVRDHLNDASDGELAQVRAQVAFTRGTESAVHLFGNGASFAIASHVATDLSKACGVRAYCYSDTTWLSMLGNDVAFENWMSLTLQHYADPGDVAIFISSSGMSSNVLRGAREARKLDVGVVTLSGMNPNNTLRSLGDVNLHCASDRYNVCESCHLIWLLSVVEELAK